MSKHFLLLFIVVCLSYTELKVSVHCYTISEHVMISAVR